MKPAARTIAPAASTRRVIPAIFPMSLKMLRGESVLPSSSRTVSRFRKPTLCPISTAPKEGHNPQPSDLDEEHHRNGPEGCKHVWKRHRRKPSHAHSAYRNKKGVHPGDTSMGGRWQLQQ